MREVCSNFFFLKAASTAMKTDSKFFEYFLKFLEICPNSHDWHFFILCNDSTVYFLRANRLVYIKNIFVNIFTAEELKAANNLDLTTGICLRENN